MRSKKVVLAELIRGGKRAGELLKGVKRTDYDTRAARNEVAALKKELKDKYMAYVKREISQDEYMAFQKEVREKTAALEGQITLTRGRNERLEEIEEMLKPIADGGLAAEGNGLNASLVQGLVESVWVGDEIEVKLKANGMMKVLEDELVG